MRNFQMLQKLILVPFQTKKKKKKINAGRSLEKGETLSLKNIYVLDKLCEDNVLNKRCKES